MNLLFLLTPIALAYHKFSRMKKVLLVGRLATNVPPPSQIATKEVELFAATNLENVQSVFEEYDKKIDMVIIGAGIDLEERLEMIKYIFNTSDATSVHLKDKASGPAGYLRFINGVLTGLLGDQEQAEPS